MLCTQYILGILLSCIIRLHNKWHRRFHADESVALHLTRFSLGEAILLHDHSRLLKLIRPETLSASLASPDAFRLFRFIDRWRPTWITPELLTRAINSSVDNVKRWGLCFLIRRAMRSLPMLVQQHQDLGTTLKSLLSWTLVFFLHAKKVLRS